MLIKFSTIFVLLCLVSLSLLAQQSTPPIPYGINVSFVEPSDVMKVSLDRNGNTPEPIKLILFKNKKRMGEAVVHGVSHEWKLTKFPPGKNYYLAAFSSLGNRLLGQTQHFEVMKMKE